MFLLYGVSNILFKFYNNSIMNFKWILVILLVLIIFLSGCEEKKPPVEEFQDDALKFEYEVKEQVEAQQGGQKILPGQTVRMVIYLTSQVQDDIKNVYIKITNPYGIKTDEIHCYPYICTCDWSDPSSSYFNGCYIQNVASKDFVEVYFSLKMPTEEEISSQGRDLKPEITLKYDYNGTSILYIPVLRETEQTPTETSVETTQTKGPIHADLKSDKWVRSGNEFPLIVDVKDVLSLFSQHQTVIDKNNFHLYLTHLSISGPAPSDSFDSNDVPKDNIIVPMKNPLVATLKAETITSDPMVRATIRTEYSYTYEKKVVKIIRVEKALG